MEDLSKVIVMAITEFLDDEELVKDALSYLYHNENSVELESEIVNWFTAEGRCLECGTKLITYEGTEIHDELEYGQAEPYIMHYCPICDKNDLIRINSKRR